MDPAGPETDMPEGVEVRVVPPDEPLSPAAREALNRRSLEEHQAAIDRALRRR